MLSRRMGTKTHEKEDSFTPSRNRLDSSVASCTDGLNYEGNGAEPAIARSWSGMDSEMVLVDKEQNSTFFKKPPPAGEKNKVKRISKVITMNVSCKFYKWMPALTASGRLCIKGKVKGITNSLLITEPVVHRFNNCVVAGNEGIFHLGAFISAGLPSFIAEKFKNGFPRDWSALCKTWFHFKQQGEPESFTWKEMLWNSINMSPDTDGEKEYSADIETDGEGSVTGNKIESDTDQCVFHSPLPRSKKPQVSVSHTGCKPLICDSPSSYNEPLSVLKRNLASQKNTSLTNDCKNMTNLEETPKSFGRRRYSRNLSFYASLSQSVEQKSMLLDASPHQTPDACTDRCFRNGVNCCSTPVVVLKNIHSTSDKQPQGHILSPTHDIVTAETSGQMEISLKENHPESQNKNSGCNAESHKESDVPFATPLHTSHEYCMQKISESFSQQASKSNFPEKLASNNNSPASKHSLISAVKHNKSRHNYTLRSKFRDKVDCSLESSDQSMSCGEIDRVDNAEVVQKQSSTRVQSQIVHNRSKKEISFVSHPSAKQSSRDLQLPQISQSLCEKMQRSFHKGKVCEMLANECGVSKNPADQPCNAVSCSSRKSDADGLVIGISTSDQDANEEFHQSVHSSNQQEVESKLAHLSINTPKVNTSNKKDTAGKHYVINSCGENSIIHLKDVTDISESLKNLSTNDGSHCPTVKIPEAEFKLPQALSPLVMVEKFEGHLGTQKISLKPQMLHSWTPVLLPLTIPRFRLQGQLKRFSGRKNIVHITKPVRKVLKNNIVSTTDGQRYQLIGPAVESSDIPKNILSQFANGIPKNWGRVLQQWIREGEVPVPRRKNEESVTYWTRSSFSSSVVSSTSLDNLQGIAGLSRSRRGRIIVPQLSYWLGERVKTGSQGPIYECNASASLLSDSTSSSLVSYQGRKRKCSNRLPTTQQRIDSENRGPTTVPMFYTRGREWKVGVKGNEEDKGERNEGQNTFPVTASVGAAKDEVSKKLLDTPASEEHTKQNLTINKIGIISEPSTQENRKGILPKQTEEPGRYIERRRKSRRVLQKQLKEDNSEQEGCKSTTNSLSEKMEQVVENSVETFLNGSKTQGKRESRSESSDQTIKRNVTHRERGVGNSERRNISESKSKVGENQPKKTHKSWKNSNVEQGAERAVKCSEIISSSLGKVNRKCMDTDIGESSGYENMEPIIKSSKIRCRSRNRSQQKVKLDEELSEKYNKTKKIKQGYKKSRRNRSNMNSSLEKQGQSSEQEHSKSLDSEDVELSQENVEGTKSNGSHSQYMQEDCRRHESRKNSVLKEKNQHYDKSSRSSSHSQKKLVAQKKNSECGESSVHKDDNHYENLPGERLRSRSRSINLNECRELLGKRDKSTESSIGKEKNVSTQEKDMGNHKMQNHRTHKYAGAQLRLDSSQENIQQGRKCSSREKPTKSVKSRHLVEDDKTSPEKRHETVLSTPDTSQKKKPLEKALFELPFEVKPLRTVKQRQLANDDLLKMRKAVAVNTDFFGDPECPYDIGEDCSGKALTYSDILNEARRDRHDKSNASSCSAVTPPAKYYEKILHRAVPPTPCRSPPIEPPIYNRKDVLSRIQQQVQAPIKTYQMEVKTNQQPCEDSIQLRMDMEKKRKKEFIIPGYDIKVRYTNEDVSDDDDDDDDDDDRGSSSFSESRYSAPL